MFGTLEMAPSDPILGLTEAFKKDSNPEKINLGVGVYKDEHGKTPVLASVKKAEAKILADEDSKGYLPIDGSPAYAAAVQGLLLGADHELVQAKRVATIHSPGGTGALRVAAGFLQQKFPEKKIWVSDPTWANHPNVFKAAGMTVETYPYFDKASNGLAFDNMLAGIKAIPAGDVVLLHGCCHNPTGIDPTAEQWEAIAAAVAEGGLLPLLDFAYQGFASGLREDAVGLRTLCAAGVPMLVAGSFSKNFGLYNERVGSLSVIGASADDVAKALSHIKAGVRANYSNPPSHGGSIVTTVLNDAALRAEWEAEVAAMRDRINGMRTEFVDGLKAAGVERDFSFIKSQRGMFSFSGLTKDQVGVLREKYSIYIVGSGRINVAGMTRANMGRLCAAIADVL